MFFWFLKIEALLLLFMIFFPDQYFSGEMWYVSVYLFFSQFSIQEVFYCIDSRIDLFYLSSTGKGVPVPAW